MKTNFESRAQRLARWTEEKRGLVVLKEILRRGVVCYAYCVDESGVTHRLNSTNGYSVCGAWLLFDAPVLFSVNTNCVLCTSMTL